MTSGIAPQIDDEITEPVDDLRVVAKARRRLDIPHGAQPFSHSIEVSQFQPERGEDRKARQPSGFVSLIQRQIAPDDALD